LSYKVSDVVSVVHKQKLGKTPGRDNIPIKALIYEGPSNAVTIEFIFMGVVLLSSQTCKNLTNIRRLYNVACSQLHSKFPAK